MAKKTFGSDGDRSQEEGQKDLQIFVFHVASP
jgi:hypothetical protein